MTSENFENEDQLLEAERMRIEHYIADETEVEKAKLVIEIMKKLEDAGILVVAAGGYGLDALYGKLTRDHGDIDFVCRSVDRDRICLTLSAFGCQQVEASSVKDVYMHPTLPTFKIEIGFDTALRALGADEIFDNLPEYPNAHLLDAEIRVVPIEGAIKIGEIQAKRAKEGQWEIYAADKAINRQVLIEDLINRK